jgi:hypothetical protein
MHIATAKALWRIWLLAGIVCSRWAATFGSKRGLV